MIRPPRSSTLFPYTTLFRFVLGIIADGEQTAVNLRVKGLHSTAEYLWKTGHLRHVANRQSGVPESLDRKSTRLNSSHSQISYAVFCLNKKTNFERHVLRRQS